VTARGDARQLSAARRQAAQYRRVLEELLQLATNHLLANRDDVVAYKVVDIVGPILAAKAPHGQDAD